MNNYLGTEEHDYQKLINIDFRNKQSIKFKENAPNIARQILINYLSNYLYIDEIQYWIIEEAVKYEHKVMKYSKAAQNHFSIKPWFRTPDEELLLYRNTLFEILL